MAPPMEIRAITWNLFHGRDFPGDPALHTWRSRVRRTTERNATHVQVNRELREEFATVLCAARWDVALLQECPPRWSAGLAAACRADAQRSLTSRNWLGSVRGELARWNPDLLGSWEGGSNLTLARGPDQGRLVDRRELVLRRRPERRTMAFARLGSGLCVANLHASTSPARAEADVRHAVEAAVAWAADSPLILGGDFNTWSGFSDQAYLTLARQFPAVPPSDRRPTFRGLLRLDHLFFRLEPGWSATFRRADDRFRSDHYPLIATVRFQR